MGTVKEKTIYWVNIDWSGSQPVHVGSQSIDENHQTIDLEVKSNWWQLFDYVIDKEFPDHPEKIKWVVPVSECRSVDKILMELKLTDDDRLKLRFAILYTNYVVGSWVKEGGVFLGDRAAVNAFKNLKDVLQRWKGQTELDSLDSITFNFTQGKSIKIKNKIVLADIADAIPSPTESNLAPVWKLSEYIDFFKIHLTNAIYFHFINKLKTKQQTYLLIFTILHLAKVELDSGLLDSDKSDLIRKRLERDKSSNYYHLFFV